MTRLNKVLFSLISISLFFISDDAEGQLLPEAAKPQSEPMLLSGGRVHTGEGTVLDNTTVGFKDGKITYVGKLEDAGSEFNDYKIIDVSGQHIYPGFILANSLIGIEEISGVPHSNDKLEEGDMNPSLKTVFAFDTGSEHIPTLRYNGILMVETIRSGGLISGTSAVMELDGRSWQEAVFVEEAAIHLYWPSAQSSSYDAKTKTRRIKKNKTYASKLSQLHELFTQASSYGTIADKKTNLKLESLQGLFSGNKRLAIHAGEPKEIIEAVEFAQAHGVQKIFLVTSYSALSVKDFLKENNIPVILPPTYAYPRSDDMHYDAYYRLPYLLSKEGLIVALSHTGMLSTSRNLPFYAGTAAAFGMDREAALQLISLNPAKILGIDGRVGSIRVGKDATLFVSKGDALDVQANSLSMAFIQGKNITLDGPHQELFKRYSQQFEHGK
ncbi:amidohydrolase [Croceitalea sp. MTPC5]|uniref:amidohydrolase family protein n=1 Tax=Croceitalea sp. MTPC5 TaxID=3056565 RepID=UPI002B3F7CB5|nr:amidohydrolase [Croceitalea sp. MTPC5]